MTTIRREEIQITPPEVLARMSTKDRLNTLLNEHPMLMHKAANAVVEALERYLGAKLTYEETLASVILDIREKPEDYTQIMGKLTESTIEAIAKTQYGVKLMALAYNAAQVDYEKAKRHHEDLEHVWQSIRYQAQIYVASQPKP